MRPTLKEEKRLWKRGYKRVAGIDEAGRGPLAGPVVAGAFMILPGFQMPRVFQNELRDSKKLSPKKRLEFYKFFYSHPHAKWGIGVVSEKVIDRINILQATKLASARAFRNLEKKLGAPVNFLILDGNFSLNVSIPQKSIVKADEKVFSCAAASIIAKVTRDRMMMKYHRKYPLYGFDRHKGYGTELHLQRLSKYGHCPIHRKTFAPLAKRKES